MSASATPATKVFQAIRMAVNRELGVVEETLPQALRCLKPGGLLGVITFHSLEDRLVKRYFQQEASDKENTSGVGGMFLDKEPTIITHKVVKPTDEEIKANPRCRSSKLRVAEKTMKRLLFCILLTGITLYAIVREQNHLMKLRLEIPHVKRELKALDEENRRLKFEIERFESPVHLQQLMRRPEFSHLKHPKNEDVVAL